MRSAFLWDLGLSGNSLPLMLPELGEERAGSGSVPVNGFQNPQDSISAVYAIYDNYLKGEARNYVTSYDARLGVGYTYQLSKHWSLGLEAGLNYLIQGFAPSLVSAIQNSGEFAVQDESNLVSNNNLGLSFANFDQNNFAAVTEQQPGFSANFTTQRLRADLGFNVGYQLGSRWQIRTGFSTFLRPVIESNVIELNQQRLHIGFRYQIR